MSENALASLDTCDLVEELKSREAVETTVIHPHEEQQVSIDGPAVVLVVYD